MNRLRQFLNDESGTASIEFVIVFPIVFTIFTASFESSMFMARSVMLERAVHEVVRDIRLGLRDGTLAQDLKRLVCEEGILVSSITTCINSLRIWMQPIDTATFAMVAPPRHCIDRSQPINADEPPATEYGFGSDNDIMLLRICLKQVPMFPTTAVTARMPVDQADGNYALVVTSAFVNEPG